MKTLLLIAARTYPRWWRRRYGREFEALLDELGPGWVQLMDVLCGAVIMRIRTLGVIPVACTLTGALVGGLIAARAPVLYASSSVLRVGPPAGSSAGARPSQNLLVSLESVLGPSKDAKRATSVMVLNRTDSQGATLRLTYQHSDPAEARRVTERLTAAIASQVGSSAVVEPAGLPSPPIRPGFVWPVAFGGALGLTAGGIAVLLPATRRAARRAR